MSAFTLALVAVTFASAVALTAMLRAYALRRRLLDVPNARSSHVVATPHGGGLAIVIATLGAIGMLYVAGTVSVALLAAIAGGGALVAAIGFVDDRRGVAAQWRLAGHFVAAGWAVYWIGGLPPLVGFGRALDLGAAGYVVAALYLVWMLNLTNFMDGIDGIAAVETVTVATAAAYLSAMVAPGSLTWLPPLVVAAAASGFLVWNWPPATIFMGDVGSGFLGFVLAALSLYAGHVEPRLLWCWVILLAVFVADATVTLTRRLLRGERVHEAHRSHAYQHTARRFRHLPVTLGTAVLNLAVLLPLAFVVAAGRLDPMAGVLAAYVPLAIAAVRLKAGKDAP